MTSKTTNKWRDATCWVMKMRRRLTKFSCAYVPRGHARPVCGYSVTATILLMRAFSSISRSASSQTSVSLCLPLRRPRIIAAPSWSMNQLAMRSAKGARLPLVWLSRSGARNG